MTSTHKGSQIITPPEESSHSDKKQKGRGKFALIISGVTVLLIVGGFFWYWNQSVPVYLEVTPADATIVLNGKNTTLSGDGYLQVKRGKHLLEIVSPGYSPHKEPLNISFGKPPPYSVSLSVLPGLLSVVSEPDQAKVTINGTVYGKTPMNGQELEPGNYEVLIEKENYLPHTEEVTIEGRRQRTRVETTLTPAWSLVSINTTPEGSSLYVNNQQVGKTPVEMELLLGSYDLRLEMPERETQQFSIRVPANQTINLPTRAMEWTRGSLFLGTTPEGAWVKVNGKTLGQTPGTFSIPSKSELNVTVSLLDHEEALFDLNLVPGEAVERRLELKPFTGKLQIDTNPAKAEIYLDGRIQGLSPITLTLPVKDHSIEIRKAGYIPQAHTLRPLANKTARYSFSLMGETKGTPLTDDQILRVLIAQKEDIQREVSSPYGYKLKLVEPDTYTMGLPKDFPGRRFDETEVRMRIRQPFYMGLYEVTNREFKMFETEHDSGMVKGVSLQSGDRPVVGVSWEKAVEYCNWLSDIQGLKPAYQKIGDAYVLIEPRTDGYRLPTEAEWEYVARYNLGNTDLTYPWGIEMPPLEKSGNYAGTEAKVMIGQSLTGYRDGYRATSPVGSFNPNSLGLYDLGGNVAEWCTDFYSYTYPSSPRPLVDYAGPEKGALRHIRGASWRSVTEGDLRNTSKRYGDEGVDDVGFRLVRSYPIVIE
ncbi:MAG: PEGA domain-containing protein [Verrucomicrobia bacterium]|nr:PEGA domain-containing protein [Verrucomicrobiota bacterium]